MRRIILAAAIGAVLTSALPATTAVADHVRKPVQAQRCGGKFTNSDNCSFRYKGGDFYVGASVIGSGTPEGGAMVRLEAVSSITGHRRILLSCTTPGSGACAAGGSYDQLEPVKRDQKLFCIVEGVGRGNYECGTIK
jgi:hypothetical protein